jgi:hypothetical protein
MMAQEKQPDNFDPLYAPQANGNGASDGLRKITDVLKGMIGQYVELYIGDQWETVEMDDHSRPQNSTIFGKLVEILDRFIVIDCFYIHKRTGELSVGNLVFINSFQIRAFSAVDDGGSLDDIFLSSSHITKVKKAIAQHKAKGGK